MLNHYKVVTKIHFLINFLLWKSNVNYHSSRAGWCGWFGFGFFLYLSKNCIFKASDLKS